MQLFDDRITRILASCTDVEAFIHALVDFPRISKQAIHKSTESLMKYAFLLASARNHCKNYTYICSMLCT